MKESLCCCSVAKSCPTLCNTLYYSTPGFPALHHLLELAQTQVHRVGDATQLSHPLSSPSPSAFNHSQHQGFYNESSLNIRWPKYQSCSFSISPSNKYSGPISFRVDWFDLLFVQGALNNLSNTTVQKHQFFSTQHSS